MDRGKKSKKGKKAKEKRRTKARDSSWSSASSGESIRKSKAKKSKHNRIRAATEIIINDVGNSASKITAATLSQLRAEQRKFNRETKGMTAEMKIRALGAACVDDAEVMLTGVEKQGLAPAQTIAAFWEASNAQFGRSGIATALKEVLKQKTAPFPHIDAEPEAYRRFCNHYEVSRGLISGVKSVKMPILDDDVLEIEYNSILKLALEKHTHLGHKIENVDIGVKGIDKVLQTVREWGGKNERREEIGASGNKKQNEQNIENANNTPQIAQSQNAYYTQQFPNPQQNQQQNQNLQQNPQQQPQIPTQQLDRECPWGKQCRYIKSNEPHMCRFKKHSYDNPKPGIGGGKGGGKGGEQSQRRQREKSRYVELT